MKSDGCPNTMKLEEIVDTDSTHVLRFDSPNGLLASSCAGVSAEVIGAGEEQTCSECDSAPGDEDTMLLIGKHGHGAAAGSSRRRRAWEFLARTGPPPIRRAAKVYESVICSMVAMLFLIDLLDTGTDHVNSGALLAFDYPLVVVLALEYLARLYTAVEDPQLQLRVQAMSTNLEGAAPARSTSINRLDKFLWTACPMQRMDWCSQVRCLAVLKPTMVLDALTIFSLALDLADIHRDTNQVYFRLLRVLTLCRLERELRFLSMLGRVVSGKLHELGATLFAAAIALLVSSVAMHYLEAPTNPQFRSLDRSVWWGTAALTTVGYGDIVPMTQGGRLLGGFVSVVGAALLALPAGIFAAGFQEVVAERRKSSNGAPFQDGASLFVGARLERLEARVDALKADMDAIRADQREIMTALQTLVRRESLL